MGHDNAIMFPARKVTFPHQTNYPDRISIIAMDFKAKNFSSAPACLIPTLPLASSAQQILLGVEKQETPRKNKNKNKTTGRENCN